MEFATFCNICLNTGNDVEEHENVSNIVMLLIGNVKLIQKSKVYLCRSCCVKLAEYENFRNICTTNILEFRYLYFELKRKLEAEDDPEMENKLRNFINAKVCNKGVYEKIETACAAFKDNVCSTITADSDITYGNDIDIKCERDLENEIATQLDPLQRNTYDIKMEDVRTVEANEKNQFEHKLHTEVDLGNEVVTLDVQTTQHYSNRHSNIEREGVHPVNSYKENADAEKSSHSKNQEKEKFSSGTTLSKYKRNKGVCARARTTHKFTQHDNVRIGAKSHTCNVCDKTFTQSSNLKVHQRIHSGDKPYKCNVCDKTFTVSCNLITHQRIHSGHKPFTCSLCEKAFANLSHLKDHQRIHSGDKPYTCNVCGKAFTVSSSLKKHQRIHSADKPYKQRVR